MKTFKNVVEEVFKNEIVILEKADLDFNVDDKIMEFAKFGVVIQDSGDYVKFGKYNKVANEMKGKEEEHPYIMPSFFNEVLALCACANDYKKKSVNILLTGSKGTGKSEFVREIAKKAGFAEVFQVNGREDMDSSDFFGDKTVSVDKETKQNYITFNKGMLYKAFIEGTELDENGDQILYNEKGERVFDSSGNPKVVGKPGLFFLDEFATILPSVFLAVFNRAMEIPRNGGESRMIEISTDGGKVVKSHPGFAMFLAGNTVGKGTESESQMGYTAQNNLMDDSTLDRISATYNFGYNLKAERQIILNKLKDEMKADKFIEFCKAIRKMWNEGKVETLLSTRAIVQVCDQSNLFEAFDPAKNIPLAIYRSLFCGLRDREKAGWNETIRYIFGVDVMREFVYNEEDIWYPNK